MRHLTQEEEKRIRRECFGTNVYALVHSTLKAEYGNTTEFSPTEIWVAALEVSHELLDMHHPEEEIEYLLVQLADECKTEWDAYLVLLVTSFQIAPYRIKRPEETDRIEVLLMRERRKSSRFMELMMRIANKEDELNMKIDLQTYELKDVEQNRDEERSIRNALRVFFTGARNTSDACFEHNLLVLCYMNLVLGHKYDDIAMEQFGQLGMKTEFHPTTKIIHGDENIFESGSSQENFRMSANTDITRLLNVVKQKQLR